MDFRCNRTAERFFAFIERDWQRQLLNTLGIPDEVLVHQELCQTYHCESVVLNQYTNLDLVPSAREKEIFQRVARELAGVRAARPRRRIFVSRRSITQQSNGRYRALQNEDALLGALAARNYDIVEPELLAFPEQVRLFAEAELVVGLGGAGLFNVVFCAPGTRVVSIESSTSFVHSHALMFGGLGHPFGIIFGRQDLTDETPVQKRWSLDVAGVIRALQRYERG
jgi:capsular polysaccharide biosynthesis protein